ncbi:MAG TPA: Lrp/AsnC family transcriptional regulator [Streptosporangiaceae bacterium]|nr:Lrp/AsnC family transcriptional regulator [Streptosporangiaceae bacterium]
MTVGLDALDVRLLRAVTEHPRSGFLELSRLTGVSRVTVQARLERMERGGVVTGYGPGVDLTAAGYPVRAVATLEISQGALEEVGAGLAGIPQVLEAYATTGTGDVHCQLAAESHLDLQDALLRIDRIPAVTRSNSVVVLSQVVPPRFLPLLESTPRPEPTRTRH